jgi:hypothetical protein
MSNISTDFSTWSTTPASNQPDSGDAATIQSDLQRIQAALRIIMPNVNAALTPTHTELNYVDGVTSAIQTQLNAKVSTSGATFVGAVAVPDDAYAVGWNGSANVPTKNAVYDKIESILDGQAFTGDITVPDEAYGAGWNGSLEVPTKNAVYDKIQSFPFTQEYLSGNQTITAGGSLTLAHGFGTKPKFYRAFLKCLTAQYGYAIGDEVEIATSNTTTGASSLGINIVGDATNINVRYGSFAGVFFLNNYTTGTVTAVITPANWALNIHAWG